MGRIEDLLVTLATLNEQTHKEFEVVIANMGEVPSISNNFDFNIGLVQINGDWNVGLARNEGAKVANSERLFFLDCDISVPPSFTTEVITKVKPGTAWFPIVKNSHSDYHADEDGYVTSGYGMCGIVKSDMVKIDGWDDLDGWGGEDNLFYWKCRVMQLEVLRERSGLIHRDHEHNSQWHQQAGGARARLEKAKQSWIKKRRISETIYSKYAI